MLVVELDHLGRTLTVADLWRTDGDIDAVLASNPFDVNLQVQLTHTADQDFFRFFVGFDSEGWVFLAESLQRFAHLVGVSAVGR